MKLKITGITCEKEFQLRDGFYSLSDIQDYFRYTIKKHETLINKPPAQIYANKIQNRITFKIWSGYYFELMIIETLKHLGSTKQEITKEKNFESLPRLGNTKVILIHYNIVNNQYQHESSHLAGYQTFHQRNKCSQIHFVQSFYTFKYGLLIRARCP